MVYHVELCSIPAWCCIVVSLPCVTCMRFYTCILAAVCFSDYECSAVIIKQMGIGNVSVWQCIELLL